MGRRFARFWTAVLLVVFSIVHDVVAQEPPRWIFPEQRHIEIRDPFNLPRARMPDAPRPITVSHPRPASQEWPLTLDEAIRIALANADSIRVLAGTTAAASGATIYDAAIINTQIDQARAAFDPKLQSQNTFSRTETPQGTFANPVDPTSPVTIVTAPQGGFQSSTGVSQMFVTGGTAAVNVNVNLNRTDVPNLPLNPQTANNVALSLSQPLLQGAGQRVNLAPIVIARVNTERSFFQMKDSVQELVRSVIQSYWNLNSAQIDVWSKQQQVRQGQEALDRTEARMLAGFGNAADVAQARVSLRQFQANLIASQANAIQQDDALRNLLGLPPADQRNIVLATPPRQDRVPLDWQRTISLAEQFRPDLIELKLVIEADQQQLVIAQNGTLPQLNATALYRWNGLDGRTPENLDVASRGGQFADWQLGVNFSVPLGLRQGRATFRQQELILARDRLNLDQALFGATHFLGGNFRNLDQYYEQYKALDQVREAALENLQRQFADYRVGRPTLYLNVLQAITDWGNAVSSESQSLANYNAELASLERQTGTILETHGVRFAEERYKSIGPLGQHFDGRCYPRDQRPGPNADRYPVGIVPLPTPPDVEALPAPPPQPPGTGLQPGGPAASRGSTLELLPPNGPRSPPPPNGRP